MANNEGVLGLGFSRNIKPAYRARASPDLFYSNSPFDTESVLTVFFFIMVPRAR